MMHRIVIPYWQADAEYNLSVQVRGPGIDGEVELGSSNLRSFLNRNQQLDPSPGIDTEGYRLPELTAEAAEAFERLTELYLAERFGAASAGPEAEATLVRLREALRRARRPKAEPSSLDRAA